MKCTIFTSLLFVIGTAVAAYSADTIIGKVTKVRDADTITVKGVAIRLNSINAPEDHDHETVPGPAPAKL